MRQRHEWFGPDALASLYRTYLVGSLVVTMGIPIVVTLLVEDAPWFVPAGLTALTIGLLAFFWWWAGAYARSVGFRLTDDEIESRGGVWWHSQSTVPYSRITNAETKQGPITRRFGVGSVAIQTAGQGAQSTAELTIQGVADYEDLREQILESVREGGDEYERTGEPTTGRPDEATLDALLEEVRAIRQQLE
ncbi:membrane-flanked domain protein [Halorhabdus tiamatea SARL4B]|uniref:Membrane-flanked domain protein n=1 Tax=Halorhabdus tiamatea SARL4B TaxID=1033806 RepID=F7PK55_9EURY|nr:PH domain-containing protein [Halorhabdus tiamatea]ERJ07588.1 membrane-flanked domain protein [Halorhabdus tiamatea SARL4B]CCQ33462.1 membrane-flanked domain protein [Halorhabdus tiamatea SARL4B]